MRFRKNNALLKQEAINDETQSNSHGSTLNSKIEYIEESQFRGDLIIKKEEPRQSDQQIIIVKHLKEEEEEESESKSLIEDALPCRGPRKNPTTANADSKNIVKNYGKALCAFASSRIALPYILNIIAKNRYDYINVPQFMATMKLKKETTNSMASFRKLLIAEDEGNEVERTQIKLFKELSVIFIKYFSVNWIYSGRLLHKRAHLKFRFKMLRRIENPEYFTYLKI